MGIRESLATNVKRLRLHEGLSQAELAKRAGISTRALQKLEASESAATVDTLDGLATALETAPWDLLKPIPRVNRRVRAKSRVTEGGYGYAGNPDAKDLSDPGWIHAEPGDEGRVVHVTDEGLATIQFDRTGTATLVWEDEVEYVDET